MRHIPEEKPSYKAIEIPEKKLALKGIHALSPGW